MSENKVWTFCLLLTDDYCGMGEEVKVKVVVKDVARAELEADRQFSDSHCKVEILSYE